VALLPRLGPTPRRRLVVVACVLLVAVLVVLGPGLPGADEIVGDRSAASLAETLHMRWLLTRSDPLASMHSRVLGFPAGVDVLSLRGPPLDALLAAGMARSVGWVAGNQVYSVAVLFGLGLAVARLAGRWWRSSGAAAVAGCAVVASGGAGAALAEGRTDLLLALALHLVAGERLLCSLGSGRPGRAVQAGLFAGLGLLACWASWVWLVAALVLVAVLALLEGRRVAAPLAAFVLVSLGLAGLPLVYMLVHESLSLPANLDGLSWSMGEGGALLVIEDLHRRASAELAALTPWMLRPLLLVAACCSLMGSRIRRLLLPVALLALVLLASLGPVLVLPWGQVIPLPSQLLLGLSTTRGIWEPTAAKLLLVSTLALLAGGGAAALAARLGRGWLAPALVTLLVGEAFLVRPELPVQRFDWRPSERSRVLAQGRGPALLLPSPGGYLLQSSEAAVDQLFHQRPLANWFRHPDHALSPSQVTAVADDSTLGTLYACERAPEEEASSRLRWLGELGVVEVYVDMEVVSRAEDGGVAYLNCLERELGDVWASSPPYRVYPAGERLPDRISGPAASVSPDQLPLDGAALLEEER
jgi:hypothetical protein